MLRALFILVLISFLGTNLHAQNMDSHRLKELIAEVADTLQNSGNAFQFMVKEKLLVCIYDEEANRMRIMSPITERKNLEEKQLLNALVANFHTALDVKYALSDEIVWSLFTHPLRELNEDQVVDALRQVYLAAVTFGTTYSSTNMVFPGNTNKEEIPEKILEKG